MDILIACESSGIVRDAFKKLGHNALSCDLLPTERPGKHYQGDIFDLLYNGWDMLIAFPPCTYLTTSAEWAYSENPTIKGKPRKLNPGTLTGKARKEARKEALTFVEKLWKAPIQKKAFENPVGVINAHLPFMPKPQIIQPHFFGEDASKTTCLWLYNLPKLRITKNLYPPLYGCKCGYRFSIKLGKYGCPNCNGSKGAARPIYSNQTASGQNALSPSFERWKDRSRTYPGVAEAMATQWGTYKDTQLKLFPAPTLPGRA